MDIFKGWRTRMFAGAVFALGLLDAIDPHMLTSMLDPESRPYVMVTIAVLIYVLRQITTTAPGRAD